MDAREQRGLVLAATKNIRQVVGQERLAVEASCTESGLLGRLYVRFYPREHRGLSRCLPRIDSA